jgi:hypothetical protein
MPGFSKQHGGPLDELQITDLLRYLDRQNANAQR